MAGSQGPQPVQALRQSFPDSGSAEHRRLMANGVAESRLSNGEDGVGEAIIFLEE